MFRKKDVSRDTRAVAVLGSGIVLRSESFVEGFGESIIAIIKLVVKTILQIILYLVRIVWKKSKDIRKKTSLFLRYSLIRLMTPIMGVYSRFELLFKESKKIREQKGKRAAVVNTLSGLNSIAFGEDGVLISLFNIAAPIICIIFFFSVVEYNNSLDYAVRLEVDGELYGYIENDQVFAEAEKYVDSRLSYIGSSRQINAIPSYIIEKIGSSDFLNPIQVADLMLNNSDISVQQAYGIYMNGLLVGAVTDNSGIKKALEGILDVYRTGAPDEEVRFVQNIDYEQGGIYTSESVIDPQIIINQVTSLKQQAEYYTVERGDNPSLIGDKLDMTAAELEVLNPGFSSGDFNVGDKIQYSVDVAFLDVSITGTEVYETYAPYSTVYQNDGGMYVDTSRVIRKGENGISRVTARVSKVNGEERERRVISSYKLTDPIDEIVAKGTKIISSGNVSTEGAGYGKFIWPISRGSVRSMELHYSDGGYYRHSGIDFVAPYGTPIFAGDGGVVVLSGWYYDYGRTVIIEHPNGIRTLYAHNSQNFVSVGEYVSQGQQIAAVGQTGRAYGNHVHFEVIQGGQKINPRYYLDGIL